ncbi:hypothetical protein CEUSTIGMA_g2593.t1 [Chlamydomonas eustigma]|uniref:Uncharacterized protein n=1 Tax=Chlamydomonas eustigma TaxID=1157962 RepID=A0A250WWS3_9CHLO|nr:hypothetical protein CEUSTIGMA_g2593.t1 [Chlamydomonas eustigma]|eukprot:GAX75149.1 hypothetical protein CEUSTIGMA_g2593.t1 [Chlamydomonas eustigma]
MRDQPCHTSWEPRTASLKKRPDPSSAHVSGQELKLEHLESSSTQAHEYTTQVSMSNSPSKPEGASHFSRFTSSLQKQHELNVNNSSKIGNLHHAPSAPVQISVSRGIQTKPPKQMTSKKHPEALSPKQLTAWIIHAKTLKELKGLSEIKVLSKGNIVALLTQLSWLHPVKSTPTIMLQQVHVLASDLVDKLDLSLDVQSSGMDVRERIQAVSALARMGFPMPSYYGPYLLQVPYGMGES